MSHFKYGNAGYERNNDKAPVFTRKTQRKLHFTESRCYWLKFLQDIPPVVYTGKNIVVKGTTSMDIALFDAATGDLVKYGPEASAKVEVVVLNGDFDPSREYWTADQFNAQIVGGRGRSSMLGKDPYLILQGGIGSVEIKLKHKSQWKKKIKLRLGARVVDLPADTIEVREAVTGLFLVKDQRLKSAKLDPPSPSDEVWRLNKIGRGGPFHEKLSANDIRTVGDFLTEFSKNAARLRGILGPTMSDHMWNAALTHAQRCKWDDRQFLYSSSETCEEIAMVNRHDSFTDMPKNHHSPGFPPLSLDYGASQGNLVTWYSFQKLMEYLSSDDAIIFEDPEQVPYAYQQSTDPNNLLLLTCLEDDDILECVNELLLHEEPGRSCIVLSNEYKDHNINSSSSEVKKLSVDSKSWQQCVIPGNSYCALCNEESDDDGQQRGVNNFVLLPPDATVFKGYGKGEKRWTLLFIILKWFLISRIVKIDQNRIAKRQRLS